MINSDFRKYDYFTFGEDSGYGTPTLSPQPVGKVKMAIYISSLATQDNILYKDATYVGLTMSADINDSCVIDYEGEKLKVLYVYPKGRYKVVYLKNGY